MISAIVCADKNYAIGKNGDLLVRIPDDMKRFSRTTSNGTVLVGRKTYDSLPKRPLPKRKCLVITRSGNDDPTQVSEKVPAFISMQQAKDWLTVKRKEKTDEKITVIGGEQIYRNLLPYCDLLYVTKVFHEFEGADTFFPNIDEMENWELIFAGEIMECDGIKFQYRKYKNKKPIK